MALAQENNACLTSHYSATFEKKGREINQLLTPAQKKTEITKKQTIYHFPSQPGQSTSNFFKFISQSGESFLNPLKHYFVPRIAII